MIGSRGQECRDLRWLTESHYTHHDIGERIAIHFSRSERLVFPSPQGFKSTHWGKPEFRDRDCTLSRSTSSVFPACMSLCAMSTSETTLASAKMTILSSKSANICKTIFSQRHSSSHGHWVSLKFSRPPAPSCAERTSHPPKPHAIFSKWFLPSWFRKWSFLRSKYRLWTSNW
jgi:hypothetical protein